MPFARITVADPGLPKEKRRRLVTGVTELLQKDLLKEPEVTVVQVSLVPADSWFVAASNDAAATGAHLEVSITAGTNSASEKSDFLRDAYALLADVLDTVPPAVYVVLYELDPESWGFNGISQLARRRLPASA